jgi:3-carboxy-cis,cis-muconate cycloisomerase
VRLVESSSTTPEMAEIFSDRSILEAMLTFEVGLARAEAQAGLIPATAPSAIEKAARPELYDAGALASATLRTGNVNIAFVSALTDQVRKIDAEAAGYVHWGATSQDVTDTAMVLLLKRANDALQGDLGRIDVALAELSDRHAKTVMLGRTLLQAALPITFGLKAAGWLGALRRNRARLETAFHEAMIVQFGGAAGTLASLRDKGIAVGELLARELSLGYPKAPWQTQRDRLATLMCALGVTTGSLGKMARDISLLSQNEVAEVAEPTAKGRGGSSAMVHKQNPVGCMFALASAGRVPGLVSTFLSSMVQEHERAVGGWQSEWATISAIVEATGLAASSMAEVAEGLTVDPARMREHITATDGTIFAERATMLLAAKLGRDTARSLVEKAVTQSMTAGRQLADVLAEMPEVTKVLDAGAFKELQSAEGYLGVAEQFRRSLVESAPAIERARENSEERKR